MRILTLTGYGISLRVDSGKLMIRNGKELNSDTKELTFKPKSIDLDQIVIYGHSGNITLDAMKWIAKHNVQLTLLNWDGSLLSTLNPPEFKMTKYRMAQYQAYNDALRIELAKLVINAKISNSILVLDWLRSRYDENSEKYQAQYNEILKYQKKLPSAKSIPEIMGIEGMVARYYFEILNANYEDRLEFNERSNGRSQRSNGATDPVNALFNYGYSILESQCWKAVYSSGLDPGVGFLHEINDGKSPLIYDLQEPFRWLVDITILEALERKLFTNKDFMLTENYNIRIRPDGVKKLMDLLETKFSSKVSYGHKTWEWQQIIQAKAVELARHLTGERKALDLADPSPMLMRDDSWDMREKIKNMSYAEWKNMGFSKGTLHNLKKNAEGDEPFKVYGKVKERLTVE